MGVGEVVHAVPSLDPEVGRWLAIAVGTSQTGTSALDPQTVRHAAPAALLLGRDAALRLAGLVGTGKRTEAEDSLALRLVGTLTDAAYAMKDPGLAQLLDWWWSAWTGQPRNGCFFADRHVPAQLHRQMTALLQWGSRPMLVEQARRYLVAAIAGLETLAERSLQIDWAASRDLISLPVGEVARSVAGGGFEAGALLAHDAQELVRRVALTHQIPHNGSRFKELVTAVEQARDRVQHIQDLVAFLGPDRGPAPLPSPRHRLREPLAPVLHACLYLDDVGGSIRPDLESLAAVALDAIDGPQRVLVARLLEEGGLQEQRVQEVLNPPRELEHRASALMATLSGPPDDDLQLMYEILQEALDRGQTDEARQWLDDVESEIARQTAIARLRARAARLEALLAASPGVHAERARTGLQEAETALAALDVDKARNLLDLAAIAAGVPAPAAPPSPSLPEGHPPGEQRARLSAARSEQRERPAPVLPDTARALLDQVQAAAGDPDRADELLLEHGRRLQVSELVRMAGLLEGDHAGAAVQVLRLALRQSQGRDVPRVAHELIRLLVATGDTGAAWAVFDETSPPAPARDLVAGAPLAGAEQLRPWLPAPVISLTTAPALRAAVGIGPDRPRAERAEAFTAAVSGGVMPALPPAVACWVEAGEPVRALELYRDHALGVPVAANLCWNLGCAYAEIGAAAAALACFRCFADRSSSPVPADQKTAVEALFLAAGEAPPALSAGLRQPLLSSGDDEVARAKVMYQAGDVDAAAAKLWRLVRESPGTPGAYLLYRILRERHALDEARRLTDEIRNSGAITWRHLVELSRVAIESGDLDVAAAQLEAATRAGAPSDWTAPLVGRLAATRPEADEPTARLLERRSAGEPAALHRARARTLTLEEWRAYVGLAVSQGQVQRLLEEAVEVSRTAPWCALPLAEAVAAGHVDLGSDAAAGDLIRLTARSGQAEAVGLLARHLLQVQQTDLAARLLRLSEPSINPQELPRLWFSLREVLAQRPDRAGEHEELLRLTRPPVPPAQLPARRHDRRILLGPRLSAIAFTTSTSPELVEAQQTSDVEGYAAAASLWAAAARAGHNLAFSPALGALVSADDPEAALQLYRERADHVYVAASAAWNVGVAYAAAGMLDEAALTFEYWARVTTRPPPPDQELPLAALFAAVGRPVPEVRRPGGESPGDETELLSSAFRTGSVPQVLHLLARYRTGLRLDDARHLVAGLEREGLGRWRYRVETARIAFDAGRPADAVQELELAELQDADPAWTAPLWQRASAAAAPAMSIEELRDEVLSRPTVGAVLRLFKMYRAGHHLAEARTLVERLEALGHAHWRYQVEFAQIAVECEAADLARQALARAEELDADLEWTGPLWRQLGTGGPTGVSTAMGDRAWLNGTEARRLGDLARDPDRLLAGLEQHWAADLDDLDRAFEQYIRPELDQRAADPDLGPEARIAHERGLSAALVDDWDQAASRFRAAVRLQPGNVGLIGNCVVALLRSGSRGTARALAEEIDHSPRGSRLLASIDLADGRLGECERRLALLGAAAPADADLAAAHAGLLLRMGAADRAAARLLESAASHLPGRPHRHAVLAGLLAGRAGDAAGMRDAVDAASSPELAVAEAVDWACRTGHLEALDELHGMLPRHLLPRLVDRFGGDDRDRFERFLRSRGRAPHSDVWCLEALAWLEERDGDVPAAFDALADLARLHEPTRAATFANLVRLCTGGRYADGLHRLLELQEELGQVLPEQEQERITERLAEEQYIDASFRSELQSACLALLDVVVEHDPDEALAAISTLAERLVAGATGSADASGVPLLRQLWERQLQMLALAESDPGNGAARSEYRAAEHQARQIVRTLVREAVRETAAAAQRHLSEAWERVTQGVNLPETLVEIHVDSAIRWRGGMTDIVFTITPARDLSSVTVECAGERIGLAELRHGRSRQAAIAVSEPVDEPVLRVAAVAGRVSATMDHAVRSLQSRDLTLPDALFDPGRPTTTMFVGRRQEREQLQSEFRRTQEGTGTLRFLSGPREIGKSSLAWSLGLREDGGSPVPPPERWPIPHVLAVMIEAEGRDVAARNALWHVAAEVHRHMSKLAASLDWDEPPELPPPASDTEEFMQWFRRLGATYPGLGWLLMIDEVQSLLKALNRESSRLDQPRTEQFAGALRRLRDPGMPFSVMLLGSCSVETVRAELAGAKIAREITDNIAIPVGFLSEDDTAEAFHRGFNSPDVTILPDAVAEVQRLTGGYPYHVHHIGKRTVGELIRTRTRVVTASVVNRVAAGLSADEANLCINDVLDVGDESRHAQEVLVYLAAQSSEGPAPLAESDLVPEARELVRRYDRIGLLRRQGGQLHWTNHLIWEWLQAWAKRKRQEQLDDRQRIGAGPERDQRAMLEERGYDVLERLDSTAVAYRVSRGQDLFLAKRVGARFAATLDGDPDSAAERIFGQFLDQTPLVQAYQERVGDFFIFRWVKGEDLAEIHASRRRSGEHVDPKAWVRYVATASETVKQIHDALHLTHGNLKPTNIVLGLGDTPVVIDWGGGELHGQPTPLTAGTPGYQSPHYSARWEARLGGAEHRDDVFALGVTLYQLLHPDFELPYDHDALARYGRRAFDLEPLPLPACPDDLWSVVRRAIDLEPVRRWQNGVLFAQRLRAWLQRTRA